MTSSVTRAIADRPMTPIQILTIGICVVLNMLDGFDILAMAFTAPGISAEWGVAPQTLGLLFSAAPVGMAIGALFMGPFADKAGRRLTIILCLIVITAGMLSSAFTNSVPQLFVLRLVTGVGIGAILPILNTVVAEYSSRQWRDFSISLMHAGYPIGVVVGGSIAVILISQYGWRSIFVLGGSLSAVMLLIAVWKLPESLDFLIVKRPANALEKTNALLKQLGQPALAELPETSVDDRHEAAGIRYVLSDQMRSSSLLLWCAFFLLMFTMFFLQSWTPQILVDAGFTEQQGITGGIAMSFGGIVGGIVLGFSSIWLSLAVRIRFYLGVSAVAMIAFILLAPAFYFQLFGVFLMGFFVFGSMTGLYAAAPRIYPTAVRATGVAWGVGIGRFGAILGPAFAGLLIGAGVPARLCFVIYAAVMVLAVLTMLFLRVPEPARQAARYTP